MGRKVFTGSVGNVNNLGTLDIVNNRLVSLKSNDNVLFDPNGTGVLDVTDQLTLTANSAASSSTTGTLRVTGGAGITGTLFTGGSLNATSGINSTPISGTSIATLNTLTATGTSTIAESLEVTASKTGATGTVIHDFTESNTWVHTSIAANFTVNLTNVPTTNDRAITISLYLSQGTTARLATGFQIDGVTQTILWSGYAPPVPQANANELQTFTLLRSNNTWSVFSSVVSLGTSYITSNLRSYYDAGLSASAPTGANGTTWVDISGNTLSLGNLSLAGTDYSYSTATGTGSVFGDTQRLNVNSAGIPVTLTNFSKAKGTFEFWIRATTYLGGHGLFVNRSDSTPNDSHWFWLGGWNNGETYYHRSGSVNEGCCANDLAVSSPRFDATFPLNQWRQLTATWDYTLKNGANYVRVFANGSLYGSRLVTNNIIPDRNVSPIGRFFNGHENGAGTTWRGHCAIIRHYNEPLSQAEVLRNFNANRSRFGI